jgi:hypothetical protein
MLIKTKLTLATALILGTLSAASAESWDPVPADRYPHATAGQLDSRNLYDVRMQVGRSAPTIYVEKTPTADHAARTFDGGGW